MLYEVITKHLAESRLRFKTLFQNSPIGMAMVDFESGRFLEANNVILEMSGHSYAERNNFV